MIVRSTVTVTVLMVMLIAGFAHSGVIQVPGDHPTIQGAIDASSFGDTVLVAPGEYPEQLFIGEAPIVIMSEHGAEATVIDAAGAPAAVNFQGVIGSETVLKGFAITGASSCGIQCGPGASPQLSSLRITANPGFGLKCVAGWPLIDACVFTGSGAYGALIDAGRADVSSSVFFGRGVRVVNAGRIELTDCQFIGNSLSSPRQLDSGPGTSVLAGRLLASHCSFKDYAGTSSVDLQDTGLVEFQDCEFSANTSEGGSAIYSEDSRLVVLRSTFASNTATQNGGAVLLKWGGEAEFSSSTFVNNAASGLGGAVSSHDLSDVRFQSCVFRGNSSGSDGGALRVYGPSDCALEIRSCLFYDNFCGQTGSAIRVSSCSGDVTGCTIVGCIASSSGAAVHIGGDDEAFSVIETIIAWCQGFGVGVSAGTPPLPVDHCDIFETTSGLYAPPLPDYTGLNGNISCDPQFCGPTVGDYSIDEYSCCASAGPQGEPIGALGIGCSSTAAIGASWSSIKAMFR